MEQGGTDMTRPRATERPANAPHLRFDLAEAFAQLKREPAWSSHQRSAVTLLKDAGMRVVLVGIHKGAAIEPHKAEGPISVHLLSGAIRVTVAGEGVALRPGQVLTLWAGIEHDVHADEESAFLLTMATPG
jgi:quercetin dioxygenase-like cupin family protein